MISGPLRSIRENIFIRYEVFFLQYNGVAILYQDPPFYLFISKPKHAQHSNHAGSAAGNTRTPTHTQEIIGIPVFAHFGDIKVLAAPAYEFYEVAGVSNSYFLFRVGGGYDFHSGSMSITPGLNFDFVHGKTLLVGGVSFGIGI